MLLPHPRPPLLPYTTLFRSEGLWSDKSPEEGTEECICMVCAKMIGACEEDPRWEDHDYECTGCELCEIAVRIWKGEEALEDRKSTRLNSSHLGISYAVFCLK